MDWVRENWFFIMFFILFIAMHLFGHGMGGCGGHGHGHDQEEEHKGHGTEGSPEKSGKKGGQGGCC